MINITPFVMCLLFTALDTRNIPDYERARDEILRDEQEIALGSKLILSYEEEEVNSILKRWKNRELDEAYDNPQNYNLSNHFFTYRDHVKSSRVYQLIRKMPKGAALHTHSSYMLDVDSLIELTYEDHCYVCYHDDFKLFFSDGLPEIDCPVKWKLMSELRAIDNATLFDDELKKHFTLVTDDASLMDANINEVWRRFEKLHSVIKSLISYRPVREKYFRKVLEYFYEDNVLYIEIRTGLSELYDLDGRTYGNEYMVKMYKDITDQFKEEHPDFIGVKLILSNYRRNTPDDIQEKLYFAEQMKKLYPSFFAGFDLVGQEDMGRPLKDFIPVITEATNKLDYYFHAGETPWFGMSSDENLIDAVLLDSKRIGHAFALLKHPKVMQAVVQKDIGLEVNVISNNVLALVRDVRNHPLATLLALGMPVVLSSDDPGAWGADPLSHDFYVVFMAVASRHYDLKLLKQLALNSIKYSALDGKGKNKFSEVFDKRWNEFITVVREAESDLGPVDQGELLEDK